MSMDEDEDSDELALPPSEAAREKRRDHDAQARTRAGMRTGLAKQFKQVLDIQRRRAEEDELRSEGGPGASRRGGEPGSEPRRKR
jgi:hypothetical protein